MELNLCVTYWSSVSFQSTVILNVNYAIRTELNSFQLIYWIKNEFLLGASLNCKHSHCMCTNSFKMHFNAGDNRSRHLRVQCNAMESETLFFLFIRNFPPRLWENDTRYTWNCRYKLNSWMNDSMLKKTRCVWMHKQNERQKKNTKITHALNEQELNDSSVQNPYTLFLFKEWTTDQKTFYRFRLITLARFKFIFNFLTIFSQHFNITL